MCCCWRWQVTIVLSFVFGSRSVFDFWNVFAPAPDTITYPVSRLEGGGGGWGGGRGFDELRELVGMAAVFE
jgi:hypothetical protein